MNLNGKDFYKHKLIVEKIGSKAGNLFKLKEAGILIPTFFVLETSLSYAELHHQVKYSIPNSKYFAVRSSAISEDSKEKSYAGHFYTAIGVRMEHLVNEVDKVQRSFTEIGGSVIIQEFIPSEKAGVVFSDAGNRTMVINANMDLCDPVVRGQECDEYLVDINGNIIKKYTPLAKKALIFKNGEFEWKIYDSQVLNNKEIKEIFSTAKQIEKIMGEPQDIEWCILKDKLYILQSRPITRNVFEEKEKIHFDSANIAESYSGIVLPLTFSFASSLYKNVYKSLLIASGVSAKKLNTYNNIFSNMLSLYYGRMYYNMNNWYKMMSFLPGYKRNKANLESMITSNIREEIQKDIEPSLWLQIKYPLLVLFKFLFFNAEIKIFKRNVSNCVAMIRNQKLEDLNLHECKELYHQLEKQLLKNSYLPVENDFIIMTCLGVLKKNHNDELLRDAVRFGNISVEQIKFLQYLAENIKDIPTLWEYVKNHDEVKFKKELLSHTGVKQKLEKYFTQYGGRFANELKLESEDIEENFEKFAHLLQLYVENNRALEKLQEKRLQSNFLKGTFSNFILKKFKKYATQREELRLLRSNTFGVVRKIFRRIGQIYEDSKIITETNDVFYLTIQEILEKNTLSYTNFKEIIKKRKQEYESDFKVQPPSHFSILQGEMPEIVSQTKNNTKTIIGRPCTSGKIRGTVRIFKDFSIPSTVDFDIIVAQHTDPGWTPLLGIAKGLIVEHGGILSHASIVSRELGIPTVIGATNATGILKDYQVVEVNGSTGLITIIS